MPSSYWIIDIITWLESFLFYLTLFNNFLTTVSEALYLIIFALYTSLKLVRQVLKIFAPVCLCMFEVNTNCWWIVLSLNLYARSQKVSKAGDLCASWSYMIETALSLSLLGHFVISNIESIQIKLHFPDLLDHKQYSKCLKNYLCSGLFFRDFDSLGLRPCSGMCIFSKHSRTFLGLSRFEKHSAE